MNDTYDIEGLVSEMDFSSNNFCQVNDLMLTRKEIEVLDRYKINYKNCNSLKEILYEVEDILNDMDIVDEDLDYVSSTISERDYYQNTNK